MKVLVAVEAYPDLQGGVSLYYVHVRNMCYQDNDIQVTVLNFSADEDYCIDGISVITMDTYRKNEESYGNVLILHACNIRHHLQFLKKYGNRYHDHIFFFHGHEVLRCSKVYPVPYDYVKKNVFSEYYKDIYDIFKLRVWKKYFQKNYKKIQFVFVSHWMYDQFRKWIKLDLFYLEGRYHIIYNCIGKEFEDISYDDTCRKEYDFISIRSDFDGSKYCVDVVCRLAKENPELKFCLVGRGQYFDYNEKPDNLHVITKYLKHDEMLKYFDYSKCALMPTRTDAQGVMACEIATYGMPMITSDIPVCKEVFESFDNVGFISNDIKMQDLQNVYNNIKVKRINQKNEKYFSKNTNQKEVELLKTLGKE